MRLWIRKSWKNCSSLQPPKYKLRTSSKDLHPSSTFRNLNGSLAGLDSTGRKPEMVDRLMDFAVRGATEEPVKKAEVMTWQLWHIMTNYAFRCTQKFRISESTIEVLKELNLWTWTCGCFFLLNVLENVGCKMCCYYHNWYQVAVSRCPWPWNCWQLRKQRPRCKSIIPWLLAGGFQQCWLSSYFQFSSNDGGYFFPWFSMWLCSIFWPIFVAKTTYLYSS